MTRQEERGYLLPEVINPPTICICVEIPCDKNHALAFLGQIVALGYWYTWERDELKRGTQAARVWRDIATNVNEQLNDCGAFDMTCGCAEHEGRIARISEDGVYEISDDGGETWTAAPELDPRVTSTRFAPLPGADGSAKACQSAANVVSNLKSLIDLAHDNIAAGAALLVVVGVLAELVALFLSAGALFAVIIPFTTALIGLGAAGINAAMTDAIYDTLRCILSCAFGEDGTIDEEGLADAYSDIDSDISGSANIIIHGAFGVMGLTGLNNWASAGAVSGADCSDCDPCSDLPDLIPDWFFGDPPTTTLTQLTDDTWRVQGSTRAGDKAAGFKDSFDRCMQVTEVISGGIASGSWFNYTKDCTGAENDFGGNPSFVPTKRFQWTTFLSEPDIDVVIRVSLA